MTDLTTDAGYDDDDDDDFFGSQNDETDAYGDLGTYELKSKQNEIEKISYLQAYDDHAESRLQDGFEAGYRESFATAYRIGQTMGKQMTLERFKLMKEAQAKNSPVVPVTDASCMVYQFSKEFQQRANDKQMDDAKIALEIFEMDVKETIRKS